MIRKALPFGLFLTLRLASAQTEFRLLDSINYFPTDPFLTQIIGRGIVTDSSSMFLYSYYLHQYDEPILFDEKEDWVLRRMVSPSFDRHHVYRLRKGDIVSLTLKQMKGDRKQILAFETEYSEQTGSITPSQFDRVFSDLQNMVQDWPSTMPQDPTIVTADGAGWLYEINSPNYGYKLIHRHSDLEPKLYSIYKQIERMAYQLGIELGDN